MTAHRIPFDLPAMTKLKLDGELIAGWLLLAGLLFTGISLQVVFPGTSGICHLGSAYPPVNTDADVAMIVKSGMSCSVSVRTGDATINELKIISAPQHGVAVDRGRTGVIYHSERGFHGQDFFAFELRGKSRAQEIASIVKVAVIVGDGGTPVEAAMKSENPLTQ